MVYDRGQYYENFAFFALKIGDCVKVAPVAPAVVAKTIKPPEAVLTENQEPSANIVENAAASQKLEFIPKPNEPVVARSTVVIVILNIF